MLLYILAGEIRPALFSFFIAGHTLALISELRYVLKRREIRLRLQNSLYKYVLNLACAFSSEFGVCCSSVYF